MLETFRKYTGLMFVVLILLFIGLVFFGSSGQGVFSGPKVLVANGRGYTAQELGRFSEKPARMLKELAGPQFGSPRYQAIDPFLQRMGVFTYMGAQLSDEEVTSFLINRVSLHKAMKDFGVYASTAEAEQYLKETIFWEDGAFNEAAYDEFTRETLPKLGIQVKKMNDLVGEIIALQKLDEIVGAGADVSREAVLAQHYNTSQRITYKLVAFALQEFLDKQEPAEEAIKTYWEEHKAKYLSAPKRRITYVLARPDYAALEKAKAAEPKDPAEPATPEDPANPAPPTPDSALTPDDRKKAVNELAGILDEMHDEIDRAEGEQFEKLAKENGFEIKTTELVEKEALPAELKASVADEQDKTGADLVFELRPGDDLKSSYGDIKKLGSDQWFLYRIDEVVEPVELSYEEAREQARTDVAKEAALKAMEDTAKEKRAALLEAMKGGKPFADAAKELALNVTSVPSSPRPSGGATPELTAFNLAARTPSGEVSEVEVEAGDGPEAVNRALFVFVEKREVPQNDNLDEVIDRQLTQARERTRQYALANWFLQRQAAADLKFPTP